MRIVLVDRNPDVVDAWRALTEWDGYVGDIFSVEGDALVSPANSFGFMDGGIDQVYTDRFGPELQATFQGYLKRDSDNEMLVGQSVAIPTNDPVFKYVIAAPTMRVPMRILDPNAIFLAARSAIFSAHVVHVETLIFPGMGTGCGEVAPDTAALQMIAGIKAAFKPKPFPKSFEQAQARHYQPSVYLHD